ncbi:MAG TPA: hypothetical protein PLP04_16950, partial [Bryobacteraceae bacterium]|nr:hypothetical protein [Bryobacteraceae bacterium]
MAEPQAKPDWGFEVMAPSEPQPAATEITPPLAQADFQDLPAQPNLPPQPMGAAELEAFVTAEFETLIPEEAPATE